MVISADQPKRILKREIIEEKGMLALELVTFQTDDGLAFGCRVFSTYQSRTTELYSEKDEAIAVARTYKVQSDAL